MAQMTADQLARDILARQGSETALPTGVVQRKARLTVKQAQYLTSLCLRERVEARGLHMHRAFYGGTAIAPWTLHLYANGSGVLETTTVVQTTAPAIPTAEDLERLWDKLREFGAAQRAEGAA